MTDTDIPITQFIIGGQSFWLIENFEHFYKRWQKAYRKNRFFEVKCAGRRYLMNPRQIQVAWNGPRSL